MDEDEDTKDIHQPNRSSIVTFFRKEILTTASLSAFLFPYNLFLSPLSPPLRPHPHSFLPPSAPLAACSSDSPPRNPLESPARAGSSRSLRSWPLQARALDGASVAPCHRSKWLLRR